MRLEPIPDSSHSASQSASPLLTLLELARRARTSKNQDELVFQLVNGTHKLVPYRQSVLWTSEHKPRGLSGVSQADINAPYVQWLSRLHEEYFSTLLEPTLIDKSALSEDIRQGWEEWMPESGVYIPAGGSTTGGLLCTREVGWTEQEIGILKEWLDIWSHAWRAITHKQSPRINIQWQSLRSWRTWLGIGSTLPWYKQKVYWIPLGILVFFIFPVRLTVLAPGELVPTQPTIVRSPIEGVISTFHVKPNERVKLNQPLFDFDEVMLQSRATVAAQSLETSLAQYRQTSQLALSDPKYKAELAAQAGTVQERRAEASYLADQLKRSKVSADQEGMVLFDDATSWLGKPVAIGESIMRIVRPDDVEVEAWLPLADAVRLQEGSRVQLYLQSDPLSPVQAKLRYVAHQAVERPDGVYAYRVRATLTEPTKHRVGLKGTAKLESERTTMFYWLFRRPLTVVRTTLGI
jgi:multidrug efflux pump subunit AcrA (membrane-fusion protein)